MKKKKKSSILIYVVGGIGIFLVLLIIFASKSTGFKTYKNSEYGFSMQYPSDWTLTENQNGTAVAFWSPKQNELDFFSENVNVVVQHVPPELLRLDTYSKKAIEQLVSVFKQNVEMLEADYTLLSGKKAFKIVYIGKGPEAEFKLMHVWTISGFQAYQVNFGGIVSQYDTFIDTAEKMISSFKLEE